MLRCLAHRRCVSLRHSNAAPPGAAGSLHPIAVGAAKEAGEDVETAALPLWSAGEGAAQECRGEERHATASRASDSVGTPSTASALSLIPLRPELLRACPDAAGLVRCARRPALLRVCEDGVGLGMASAVGAEGNTDGSKSSGP
jgi:hypothetical protein